MTDEYRTAAHPEVRVDGVDGAGLVIGSTARGDATLVVRHTGLSGVQLDAPGVLALVQELTARVPTLYAGVDETGPIPRVRAMAAEPVATSAALAPEPDHPGRHRAEEIASALRVLPTDPPSFTVRVRAEGAAADWTTLYLAPSESGDTRADTVVLRDGSYVQVLWDGAGRAAGDVVVAEVTVRPDAAAITAEDITNRYGGA